MRCTGITLLGLAHLISARAADPAGNKKTADWFETGAGWNFSNGPEYPGATGAFTVTEVEGKNAGQLEYDFSNGGGYVIAGHSLTEGEFQTIRFAVKGKSAAKILLRVEDAGKECLQYRVDYTGTEDWQTFEVNLDAPQSTFGGDENKQLDLPIARVYLGVTGRGISELGGDPKGEVLFSDIEVVPVE